MATLRILKKAHTTRLQVQACTTTISASYHWVFTSSPCHMWRHTLVHDNQRNMPEGDAGAKFDNREIPVTGDQLDKNQSHTSTTCIFTWLNRSTRTTAIFTWLHWSTYTTATFTWLNQREHTFKLKHAYYSYIHMPKLKHTYESHVHMVKLTHTYYNYIQMVKSTLYLLL